MRSNSKTNKISASNDKNSKTKITSNNSQTKIIEKQKPKLPVPPVRQSSSKQKPTQKNTVPVSKPLTKAPINLPKYPVKKNQQNSKIPKYTRKKQQSIKQHKWSYLPYSCLVNIVHYACSTVFQVYKLSKVCSLWRNHMMGDGGQYFWNHLKGGQTSDNFHKLKESLQKIIVEQQQKMSFQFQQYFVKLFNYGSTKQNIPNKLIQKLSLQLQVTLNKKSFIQPFKLRTFNFSSYLCSKIEQIKQQKYDFYTPHNMFKDKIPLTMNFRSKRYKVQYKIQKNYVPEDIVDGAIKQKAFNYYLDRNFVFTYFQGDNHFLYIFFEMSVLQLVNIFRSIIKTKHKQTLSQKTKKLPMYKQLCQTQFQNFQEYIKFQADFEIHFSYHNSLKQIFTHCDTKVYPIQYDNKHAYFDIKIDDSFEKVATYKLDNKMGMSESIQNLYLLDFVLKDRDRFLIIFSGFMYARKATQKQRQSIENYFDFAENQIKILQSKQQKYNISFTIIEETKKNLMKNVKFMIFA